MDYEVYLRATEARDHVTTTPAKVAWDLHMKATNLFVNWNWDLKYPYQATYFMNGESYLFAKI